MTNDKNNEDKVQMTTDTIVEDKEVSMLMANIHIVREQAKELEQAAAELESRLRIARGTNDLTEQAQRASGMHATVEPQELEVVKGEKPRPILRKPEPKREAASPKLQAEALLRDNSLTTSQLAKRLGLPVGRVAELVREFKKEKRLANVGSADFPMWTLRIGNQVTTPELTRNVRRLITERPMTTQELVDVTGAQMSRVSGVMVHFQRTEKQLYNLGTQRRARWFLLGDGVTLSRLPPKGGKTADDEGS